ncbi:MAG: AbrB/MazE/SpoVT family DNA-binding domain-containing protein [Chloroflexota bacterium]
MATRVKVSSKHQIAVPAEVRRQLHIESGDHLLMEVRDGVAVLVPEPADYVARLRGLHQEVWQDIDAQEYVRGERDAWTT